MGFFRSTPKSSEVGATAGLPAVAWLILFWLASAAIFLDMRWDAVAGLAFGDTDDAMRLVQTRDLLAGQGWFDRVQTRLAPPEGVDMHWSRLPDAALAGLILAARPLVGTASAERFAVAAWPLLLLLAWYALIFSLGARLLGGREGGLIALFLGLLAIPAAGQFLPARIDHHGLQLVLLLAFLATLVRLEEQPRSGLAAGAIAAVSLRIGLETLPHLLAAEAALAVFWARAPGRLASGLRLHGLGFAGAAILLMPATIPPSGWADVQCDSFSIVYVAAAAMAGSIWLLATAAGRRLTTPLQRFALPAAMGAAAVSLLALFFPECRNGPYGLLDPRLATLWLAHVREAQSALDVLAKSPTQLVAFLGFALLGLAGLVVALRGEADRRFAWGVIGACLLAALATAMWQIRGAFFANGLAVLPAAALLRLLLEKARGLHSPAKRGAAVLAGLALINGLPFALVHHLAGDPAAASDTRSKDCRTATAFEALAEIPPALVLSGIDLGPSILQRSPHTVLAAPYHRNTEGLATAIAIWTAAPEAARARLLARGVGLVVVCPDAADLAIYARRAPDGLAAQLRAGEAPAWLRPLTVDPETPLDLYRLRLPRHRAPLKPSS